MAEILYAEDGGKLAFGDHHLKEKTKAEDFPFGGDLLKVKTYEDITRFEKNGLFVYESVPGTAVLNLYQDNESMSFEVEGAEDAQITVELEAETEYEVEINGDPLGNMTTNLGGKLSFSVEFGDSEKAKVKITKC